MGIVAMKKEFFISAQNHDIETILLRSFMTPVSESSSRTPEKPLSRT
jgi:hypothetical protein